MSSSWSLIKGATGVCHEDIAISVQFCAEVITHWVPLTHKHKLMFSQRKILNKFHESVLTIIYYSFKIFPQFWLAKSTCIIHHNQLLMTKFGRILCLTRKWHQNAACYRLRHHYQEDLGMRLSCFGCEKKKGGHFTHFKSKNYSWN